MHIRIRSIKIINIVIVSRISQIVIIMSPIAIYSELFLEARFESSAEAYFWGRTHTVVHRIVTNMPTFEYNARKIYNYECNVHGHTNGIYFIVIETPVKLFSSRKWCGRFQNSQMHVDLYIIIVYRYRSSYFRIFDNNRIRTACVKIVLVALFFSVMCTRAII